jgi:flavin-binding protein dodecin
MRLPCALPAVAGSGAWAVLSLLEPVPNSSREDAMSDHVYAVTEVVGSSKDSIEEAMRSAISTAAGSIRHLNWFEVKEIRGHIENDAIGHVQVVMKLGFRYDK